MSDGVVFYSYWCLKEVPFGWLVMLSLQMRIESAP